MKKPVKEYETGYPEMNLKKQSGKEVFYMCEYIDARVRKPSEQPDIKNN